MHLRNEGDDSDAGDHLDPFGAKPQGGRLGGWRCDELELNGDLRSLQITFRPHERRPFG
jgi:hypothetical protein